MRIDDVRMVKEHIIVVKVLLSSDEKIGDYTRSSMQYSFEAR